MWSPLKLNSQLSARAKCDRSMQPSPHEMTEVQQTSAGLLGFCLSREAPTHAVWIYVIDSRGVGSTAARI